MTARRLVILLLFLALQPLHAQDEWTGRADAPAGPQEAVTPQARDTVPPDTIPPPPDTIPPPDTLSPPDSIARPDTVSPRIILRVDTVTVDGEARFDTVYAPDPRGVAELVAGDADLLAGIVADTVEPIRLRGFTVDILRAPMALEAVPFAVSVLQEELWMTGRSNGSIEEALQGLPGVQIHNRFNDAVGERVSIRGYGARSEFGVRGVKILVDGIPATLPDGQATLDHLDLGSLGRVEALRGPGSALYGNAAGGVLHFETRQPSDSTFRQEVRFVSGEFDYRRRQATTSGRVGGAGYFVSLSRYEFGGYRTNPFSPHPPTGGFGASKYGATRRDHLNAHFSAPLFGGTARFTANAVSLDAENPGSLSLEQAELGDRRAFPFNVQQQAGKQATQRQGGVTWDGPLGDRELEFVVYGIGRNEENVTISNWTDLDRFAGGVRGTLRSESVGEEGRLWWALGVDSEIQRDERAMWHNLEGSAGSLVLDQSERVRGGAIFLQAMLPINPVLDVLTGVRYDRIRFSARDRLGADSEGSGSRTLDSASPSFGFHAGFDERLALYLNLSTAFETPTTTEMANRPDGATGFDPELEPQVGITTEVGARGVLAPVLAWELVFFHTTLHNELIPFEVEDRPGLRYFRNSARSTREGWELALQFAPDPSIGGRLVFSTNNARYRSFTVDDVDYGGNRVPGLAPHKVEGILRVGPGRWFAEVRGEVTGPVAGNDANDPWAESPSHRLVDLRAGANEVRLLGVLFTPFLGVTNVFDQPYNTSVVVNALNGRYFEPGPGRALYLGASAAVEW